MRRRAAALSGRRWADDREPAARLGGVVFRTGETGKAEALYGDSLHADPRWGWGWLGWSDGYGITRTKFQDWQRAEQILREGLAVDQVRDRGDLLERLDDVCEGQGRKAEAIELDKQAKRGVAEATVTRQKIGRNEPCPCGSGKKFKKSFHMVADR